MNNVTHSSKLYDKLTNEIFNNNCCSDSSIMTPCEESFKNKKVTITISCSMSHQKECASLISKLDKIFSGVTTRMICPFNPEYEELKLSEKMTKYIEYIKESDFLIIIPKKEGELRNNQTENLILEKTIGDSTSWERAIANHFSVPIFIYDSK